MYCLTIAVNINRILENIFNLILAVLLNQRLHSVDGFWRAPDPRVMASTPTDMWKLPDAEKSCDRQLGCFLRFTINPLLFTFHFIIF